MGMKKATKSATYFVRVNPKGKFWGNAVLHKDDLQDPEIGFFSSYKDYSKSLKKLGWTVAKVTLTRAKH